MNPFLRAGALVATLILTLNVTAPLPAHAAKNTSHTPTAARQKQKKKAKKGKKGTPQKAKKPAPAAQPAKSVTKTIKGITVTFPSEPKVNNTGDLITYTSLTKQSAMTVMHFLKIKTDGELVYFSPEYKNSEDWKQEVMAYSELTKLGQKHLQLPAHWEAKDYKAPIEKRYAATYKVAKPKARTGKLISFVEENQAVCVQVVTMAPGAEGERERKAFLSSLKLAK